jgi:hypothetical protein
MTTLRVIHIVLSLFSLFYLLWVGINYSRKSKRYSYQLLEVNGLPVSGHEENYLLTDDHQTIAMSQLLARQGIKAISWQEATAFERREDDPDDYFLKYRQQYNLRSGRKFPPVYKIKFNITAEQLSDKDAEEFWKKQIWDSEDPESENVKDS